MSNRKYKKNAITKISVTDLFWGLNYAIPSSKNKLPSYALLYGDNGCGKTTILSLIYHLFNRSSGEGSRTWIAQVPFKKFTIEFSGGQKIDLSRKKSGLGSYTITYRDRNKNID